MITVIYNPAAGAGKVGKRWATIESALRSCLPDVRFARSERHRHAEQLAREAVEAGSAVLLSLGGDGTHNEVVNGIMSTDPPPGGVGFGILPAGTGGDFARGLAIPRDPVEAARCLRLDSERTIDVGRVHIYGEGAEQVRYFVNIASFGMSGLVDQLVNDAPKVFGGRASFFIGTVRAMARYKPARVVVTIDGQRLDPIEVGVVAVANGRYCGGGMKLAPDAVLDDGLFDVVILRHAPFLQTLSLTRHIYVGTHVDTDLVTTYRARTVEAIVEGKNPAYIDLDGEAPGVIPARFEIVPNALRLING